MTYFKLNIPSVNDKVNEYQKYKKSFFNDLENAHKCMSNVREAWQDANSEIFYEKVNENYNSCIYFNEYLDKLYKELNTFKNNIDSICHKFGFSYNSVTLSFDDSSINSCYTYLKNASYYLNEILNNLYTNTFGQENVNLVTTFWYNIRDIEYSIRCILYDLENLVKMINDELQDSRNRVSKIDRSNVKFTSFDNLE